MPIWYKNTDFSHPTSVWHSRWGRPTDTSE